MDVFTAITTLEAFVNTGSRTREEAREAVAEVRRTIELVASDTTAPDLAQEVEFLKAELAHARGGPPC